KLHFKRTPEEEAAHKLRKKLKKKSKRKRTSCESDPDRCPSTSKRHSSRAGRKWTSSDEEFIPEDSRPGPSIRRHESHRSKYDATEVELDEQRFREKMFSQMDDEERLDSIEAQFNEFAHIPGRWKYGGGLRTGDFAYEAENIDYHSKADPRYMDDEEYAEWIRVGMYRLKHAEEYAEQERKKAARAARLAEEKAKKEESTRLEKAAEEDRKRKKSKREITLWSNAREQYDQRWKMMLSDDGYHQLTSSHGGLEFADIPWPIIDIYHENSKGVRHRNPARHLAPIRAENLTEEAITKFLISGGTEISLEPVPLKEKREKLREAMLRFHPDKFEGRFMKLIAEGEREEVREGIGCVARVLNGLL
ncbi:hypothetical protein AMATHDRAFT_132868, partial [Amanita thiersii Skay4041]